MLIYDAASTTSVSNYKQRTNGIKLASVTACLYMLAASVSVCKNMCKQNCNASGQQIEMQSLR